MSRFMLVPKHDGCQRKRPEAKARRINMSPKEIRFLFCFVLSPFSLAAKTMLCVLTVWLKMSYNHHANVLSTKRKWIMSFLALSPGFQLDDDQSRNTKNKKRERGAKRDHTPFIHNVHFQSARTKQKAEAFVFVYVCIGVLYGMVTCFATSLCIIYLELCTNMISWRGQ